MGLPVDQSAYFSLSSFSISQTLIHLTVLSVFLLTLFLRQALDTVATRQQSPVTVLGNITAIINISYMEVSGVNAIVSVKFPLAGPPPVRLYCQ